MIHFLCLILLYTIWQDCSAPGGVLCQGISPKVSEKIEKYRRRDAVEGSLMDTKGVIVYVW